ncbi:hypothetical protein HmCmsJML264_02877 [Escherichia coli]|nr:hypothetical protein HmCmsJML166_02906 [Escherichia coli]GDC97761.1 hypothetical protein HmCmsJML264_02877 [Escherichia coli]
MVTLIIKGVAFINFMILSLIYLIAQKLKMYCQTSILGSP